MVKLNLKELIDKKTLDFKNKKLTVLFLTLPIPFVLALIAFLLGQKSTSIIAISSLGIVAVLTPYMVLSFLEYQNLKRAEDAYPNFLRDLAQSVSAGMTLPQAIETSTHTQYGVLTKYIKKLNIWISWDIPFPEAWEKFTKALEKSELVRKINGIILESFYSGGDNKAILNSLAEDVTLLKQMEAEKRTIMNQQILVMYLVYFIFAGVLIGLFKILAPILFIQKLGVFSGISVGGVGQETLTIGYFKDLFFLMTLIEAICAGLIAGQISEDSLVAGFKHVLIMIGVGSFLFFFFIFPTHLNLEVSVYPSTVAMNERINIGGQIFYESAPGAGAEVSILTPDKKIISMIADNLGEFERTIDAPTQPGLYAIVITVKYRGQEQIATRQIKVT